MKLTPTAVLLLIQALCCLGSDDSTFKLINKATGFCLGNQYYCVDLRWTTGDRLFVPWSKRCLGTQGKSPGSEVSLYDCDENNDLQKWECKNGTLLALKGQELYIKLTADHTATLSQTIDANNHFTISGTSSGACSRTYRELFTIGGNAHGRPCMFPFLYKNKWYADCTTFETPDQQLWCSVETKYDHELWGFCPTNSKEGWNKHITTGAVYQLNTESALTWFQAEASCKQQSASLLSITDPHQYAYLTALLGKADRQQGDKLWIGLNVNSEHGWQWSNGNPYRYINWDSGHPLSNPGYSCGIVDGAVQYLWQSSNCNKKLGYICYSEGSIARPTEAVETGHCSPPWIPYNGHCFYLNRSQKTWSDAQIACRKEGGDLVSINNVEDQSFVISQLGFASSDELWIGLNDRKTKGLFDWSDHSTVKFTSWEFGEPAIFTDKEDCVLIRGENGNWADRACEEKHGFICMKKSASEPTGDEVDQNIGCKTGWKRHGSYCYFVGTKTKTFNEAKDDCKSSDSYLADVSTGVDNAFLVSLVGLRPEKYFWLGLSNQKNIDDFVWTNTDSIRFTHWNTGMPGQNQGCVAMNSGIFAGLWDVLPCTNKEKYICKHLAEGAVLTPVPPTLSPLKCAEDWTKVGSRNYCYKVFLETTNRRTWYEARDYCKTIGGDLLSIHHHDELQVQPSRNKRFWIGLHIPDPISGYVWSDGSPVNFQHWENGKPNNTNYMESCAEFNPTIYYQSGSWRDVHCAKKNSWICQIRAGVTPNPPPDPVAPDYNRSSDGWLDRNGTQYYFNNYFLAMEEARQFCQQRHSDLVTIKSEDEFVFLWNMISEKYWSHWIGLTVDLDGTYQWMDGSQVVYDRWADGQPAFKHYDENCAAMDSLTGSWHSSNCGYEKRSICKRNGSPPANATVAPTVPPKGGCPSGWKKFNFKCYKIIKDQKLTWYGARKYCQSQSGNLASISSRHVQVFLMSEMVKASTTDLWIGLHSLHGHTMLWTDGKPGKYFNIYTKRGYYDSFYYILTRHGHLRYRPFWTADNCVAINANPVFGIGKWMFKSCNDTKQFICLRNPDPTFTDSPEPSTPPDYVQIFNDSIKVVPQQMNWDAAKKYCEQDDADLASLRSEVTQTYVELMARNLKAPLWIGLNEHQTGGFFRYTDGWRLRFTHWGYNQPKTNQSCVYMDVDGRWKTATCNQTISSVCMKSTDVLPTESSGFPGVCPGDLDRSTTGQYFWQPFKGYCYLFLTDEKTWSDAATSCVQHGGLLASIEDPSEQKFIQSNVKTFEDSHTSFWMGLFKTYKGEWLWLGKAVMAYTNWAAGQPEGDSHGSIATSDGTWKGDRYRYRRPYICKTPKVLPTMTSPSPSNPTTPHDRGHIALGVAIVIAGIAIGAVIAFVLYRKSGHHLPIPDNLTSFANPLFFMKDKPQSDVTET